MNFLIDSVKDWSWAILGAFLLLVLGSCASQADLVLASRSKDLIQEAEILTKELLLEELRRDKVDQALLVDTRRRAQVLQKEDWGSTELRAWFLGLEYWTLDLSGRRAEARTVKDTMVRRFPQSEWTVMVLIMDMLAREDRPAAGQALDAYFLPREAEPGTILLLARILAARVMADQGFHGKALAQWDALLAVLESPGRDLALVEREMTLALANGALKSPEVNDLFLKPELSLDDWWQLLGAETSLPGRLGWNEAGGLSLLGWLKARGFLAGGIQEGSTRLERRDLAYLLFQFFRELRKDPALEKRFADWKAKAGQSPGAGPTGPKSLLPDVDFRSYYYLAAVFSVERQFLNLPDGINFIPDGAVDGSTALTASKALDAQTQIK